MPTVPSPTSHDSSMSIIRINPGPGQIWTLHPPGYIEQVKARDEEQKVADLELLAREFPATEEGYVKLAIASHRCFIEDEELADRAATTLANRLYRQDNKEGKTSGYDLLLDSLYRELAPLRELHEN